jgi:hypothetical protein
VALTGATEGTTYLAQMGVGGGQTAVVKLHLGSANYTPLYSDTWASLSSEEVELVYSGYTAITLTFATWTQTLNTPNNGNVTQAYPQQTFTFGASTGATVYTYFLSYTISGTTYLLGGELLSPSYTIPTGGGSLLITPSLAFGFNPPAFP